MSISDLKISIKSIVSSSRKPLTPQELQRDFKAIEGYEFPYRKLGFSDFLQCIMSQDMSDTVKVDYDKGVQVITPVHSEKSRHIDYLVTRQKNPFRILQPQRPDNFRPAIKENGERPGLSNGFNSRMTGAESKRGFHGNGERPSFGRGTYTREEPKRGFFGNGERSGFDKGSYMHMTGSEPRRGFSGNGDRGRGRSRGSYTRVSGEETKRGFYGNGERPAFDKGTYTQGPGMDSKRSFYDTQFTDGGNNWHQHNPINLSAVFRNLARPIKNSLLSPDRGVFFASSAYGNYLQHLGELLFIIESMRPTVKGFVSNQNALLKSCSLSLDRSINIVKHSVWFLNLVLTVDDGKKLDIFQYGSDVFYNAVGVIDEMLKIFSSDEVVFSGKKELFSHITRLYDSCSKLLADLKTGKTWSHENHAVRTNAFAERGSSFPKKIEDRFGRADHRHEQINVNHNYRSNTGPSPFAVAIEKNIRSFPGSERSSASSLIGSNFSFPLDSHKERFGGTHRNFNHEINHFKPIRSAPMYAQNVENHVPFRSQRHPKSTSYPQSHSFRPMLPLKATKFVTYKSGVTYNKPFVKSENSFSSRFKTEKPRPTKFISRPNSSDKYVNIFSGINIYDWRSRGVFFQGMSELDPLKLHAKPKTAYDTLRSEIKGQVVFFHIEVGKKGVEVGTFCNLCKKTVGNVKVHVTLPEHLIKMMELFMNEESRKFLGHSDEIPCTLCNIPLYKNGCLWLDHFKSEPHTSRLRESGSNCNNSSEA